MKRLDYCKTEMARKINAEQPLTVIYQELNNMLPTYKEKQALQDYLTKLQHAE